MIVLDKLILLCGIEQNLDSIVYIGFPLIWRIQNYCGPEITFYYFAFC